MAHGPGHLLRLGALALAAGLVAAAAWTYTGNSDSSGGEPVRASQRMGTLSIPGLPAKSDQADAAKRGDGTRPPRASRGGRRRS